MKENQKSYYLSSSEHLFYKRLISENLVHWVQEDEAPSVRRVRRDLTKASLNSETSSNNSSDQNKDLDDPVIGPTTRRAWNDWCSSSTIINSSSSAKTTPKGSSCRSSADENDENVNNGATRHANTGKRRRNTQRRAAASKPSIVDEPDPPVAVSHLTRTPSLISLVV